MNITISIDGTDPKKAAVAGSFWLEFQRHCGTCGCCGSKNTVFTHRKTKGFDFYEAACSDCGGRYPFGQKKEDQSLFPKRDKGWAKFQKDGDGGDSPFAGGNDNSDSIPF